MQYIIIALIITFILTLAIFIKINAVRLFHPNTVVRALVLHADSRITAHWVVPNNEKITIDSKTYLIKTNSPRLITGKYPAYFFMYNHANAINPYKADSEIDFVTPEQLNIVLKSKFIKDILITQGVGFEKQLFIIGGIIAVALLVVGYLVYTQMQGMQNQIQSLKTLIEEILGVGANG